MTSNPDRNSRPQVVLVNRALVLDGKGKVLLIKRSQDDAYMPGKWELPGGKLESGQDITNAHEREVLEETGLSVQLLDKIAYWHSEILSSGKYKGLPCIVLVGLAKTLGGEVRISEEHEDFVWLTRNKVFDYDLVPETREALGVLSGKITK